MYLLPSISTLESMLEPKSARAGTADIRLEAFIPGYRSISNALEVVLASAVNAIEVKMHYVRKTPSH